MAINPKQDSTLILVYLLYLQYFARQHKIYVIYYIEAIIFVCRDQLIDNCKSNRK